MATRHTEEIGKARYPELVRIAEMIQRGETSTSIERVWRTFIEKSLSEAKATDRLKTFGEIWSAFQDNLDAAQTQVMRDLQRDIERAAFHDTLRTQIRIEIDRTRKLTDAYISRLEETLNTVGDDAQLANMDLQNVLQKQQQTLEMMSNISKALHDTAMATIRKIGG